MRKPKATKSKQVLVNPLERAEQELTVADRRYTELMMLPSAERAAMTAEINAADKARHELIRLTRELRAAAPVTHEVRETTKSPYHRNGFLCSADEYSRYCVRLVSGKNAVSALGFRRRY